MKDSTVLKVVAMLCLAALEVANLLTLQLDGNILMSIAALIGGLAGYEYGKKKSK